MVVLVRYFFPVTEETDLENMLLAQRKDFWQLLDHAHKGERRKASPDSKIFRTDTHLHFIEFQPRRTLLLSRSDHVNVIVRFDLMQEIRPDPNATQLLTKKHGCIIVAKYELGGGRRRRRRLQR